MNHTTDLSRRDVVQATAAYRRPGASSVRVNRARRVVGERARSLQARRKTMRGLYIPIAVCATLLATVVFALWSVLDGYEPAPTGMPDASQQIFVLLLWCLPISLAVLAVVLYRRAGAEARADEDGAR